MGQTISSALEIAAQFYRAGQIAEAGKVCHEILSEEPKNPDAWHLLGTLAYSKEKWSDAQFFFEKAISLNPHNALFYHDLGVTLDACKKCELAEKAYRRAIFLDPFFAQAYNSLGNTLKAQNKIDEAIESYNKAVLVKPDFAFAYLNLGNAMKKRGNYEEALLNFEKALSILPDCADGHWNLSLTSLAMGDYLKGWKEYEWRFKRHKSVQTYPHHLNLPRWDGKPFRGKRIFIHDEQGLGDTLQFVRYIPMVKALGGDVVFETMQPLIRLLGSLDSVDELLARDNCGEKFCACHMFLPLLSLPGIFGTTVKNIPNNIPYLTANPNKMLFWGNRISGNGLKVGLVWAGNPDHPNDHNRSCELKAFTPLTRLSHIKFFSLQKGAALEQLSRPLDNVPIANPARDIRDLDDTAAIITNLDLVISVDTCVAHLAGALGKQVWVLIPKRLPDWRWLLDRENSPWYPTMRLYRQQKTGDWDSVISRIADDLSNMTRTTAFRT